MSNGYGGMGRGRGGGRGGGGGRGRGTGQGQGAGRVPGKGRGDMRPAGFSPPVPEPRNAGRDAGALREQAQDIMDQLSSIRQRIADMEASGTSPSAPGGKRVREATAVINQELCIQCGLCIEACPEQAIRINGITEIDQSKCTGCGACANVCPNEAISIQEIALHRARS